MNLSLEERRRIYEEEKARIEAEERERRKASASSTGLEPNVAGLLCYVGGWISGIVFLVIERKNRFVCFHALQSIAIFGGLTVASVLFGLAPFVGGFFQAAIGVLMFILWIVLMVKAYQGEMFRVAVAADIADSLLPSTCRGGESDSGEEGHTAGTGAGQSSPPPSSEAFVSTPPREETYRERRIRRRRERAPAVRVAANSVAIFWDVVLLIFFSFFYRYIAWYQVGLGGHVTRIPLLTDSYFAWLPILVTALVISIAGHISMIIYDRYWFRQVVRIALEVIGIIVVANLISIFPFDFGRIPDPTAAHSLPVAVTIVLIIVAVGLGIGVLVRTIRLITGLAGQSDE